MKAIVYEGSKSISVKEISDPQLQPGWALIKVSYAGICGTDLNIYNGTHPRAKAPLVMGHEFSGTLVTDTPSLKAGTRVTVYPLLSCGECSSCLSGNAHVCNTLKLLGIDRDGGMAEYVQVPIDTIIPIDDDVSDTLGALIEPIAVGVHTLRETGFVPGDNSIVFGCGTIGLTLAITLQQFGSSSVTMVETDLQRIAIAKKLGFQVIDSTKENLEEHTQRLTNGDGFDWVFDCAGVQPVANVLFDMVRVRGHIVIVAGYKEPASLPLLKGMFKETSIQFVRVYRKKDFEIAASLASKDVRYNEIITHELSYEEAVKGFEFLTTKGTGAVKVLFAFSH
jgi:(R,R)-butanediol dehydrogenase / meso-butanediol dehydrogenase / diacetyl reductase